MRVPARDLVRVPEIPVETCLTHLLGQVLKGTEAELLALDGALATLRQRIAARLAGPEPQSGSSPAVH